MAGYADLFSNQHDNSQPLILFDGTSVQWPRGWTENDAVAWREKRDLMPPTERRHTRNAVKAGRMPMRSTER